MRFLLVLALWCCASAAVAQTGTMPGSRNGLGSTANLDRVDQVLRGGANVRSVCALGGLDVPAANCVGSVTVDCGLGPLQFLENNGALTLTAPAIDSSCFVMLYNGASAGAVTFSGFTVGSSTGAALTTTNTNLFTVSIWRVTIPGVGSTSGYTIYAHQ